MWWPGEIKIGWSLGDILRFMKHFVEYLNELVFLNLPIAVIDQDGSSKIVGMVTIYSGHAHQLPFDRLA